MKNSVEAVSAVEVVEVERGTFRSDPGHPAFPSSIGDTRRGVSPSYPKCFQ